MNERFRDILDGLCKLCYCELHFWSSITLLLGINLYIKPKVNKKFTKMKAELLLGVFQVKNQFIWTIQCYCFYKADYYLFSITNKSAYDYCHFFCYTSVSIHQRINSILMRWKKLNIWVVVILSWGFFQCWFYLFFWSLNILSTISLHVTKLFFAVCRWIITHACWATEEGADPSQFGKVYKEGVQWWAQLIVFMSVSLVYLATMLLCYCL